MTTPLGVNLRPATDDEKLEYFQYLLERMFADKEIVKDEEDGSFYVTTPANPATFDPEPYSDYDRASVKGKLVVLEKDVQTLILQADTPKNAEQLVHKLARHLSNAY